VSIKENCGVFGAYSKDNDVFSLLYWGMLAQNHRGHQSHGFATFNQGIEAYTELGLIPPIKEPGKESRVRILEGKIGIGNVRYTTSGSSDIRGLCRDAMPLKVEGEKRSLAISFNGNIVNVRELQRKIDADDSYSDTHAFAELMMRTLEKTGSLGEAVKACMSSIDGAYSITGILDDGTLFAFKDPVGIKPLCYGFKDGVYAFSSESTGLDINGIEWQRELRPGEMLSIQDGKMLQEQIAPSKKQAFCGFEFAYFARPDSRLNGKYVYDARRGFGAALARVYREVAERCDVVIGLPETANDAAYGFHEESGIPWDMATRRHRYVSQRAFITDSEDRENVIYRKLNIIGSKLVGKRLAVIDDSIVRGDTTRGTVKRFREAGCREVHLFITYPRIIAPCFYGIDMSTYSELIGSKMSHEEIAYEIGADTVNFLPIEEYIRETGMRPDQLCLGCITDNYPTPLANKLAGRMKNLLEQGATEKGRIYEKIE
jgi:amidophosphoribosyltransferase